MIDASYLALQGENDAGQCLSVAFRVYCDTVMSSLGFPKTL